MRVEYTLSNSTSLFVGSFFDSIDDFFSNFTSLYALIDSSSDRRVYKNLNENVYLIFYSNTYYLFLCAVSSYNPAKSILEQNDLPCVDYGRIQDPDTGLWKYSYSFYVFGLPTPYLGYFSDNSLLLVANYNSSNNTFMFSLITKKIINYGFTTALKEYTSNVIFGNITKYLDFSGGFFLGGSNPVLHERYWVEEITKNDDGEFDETLVSSGIKMATLYTSSGSGESPGRGPGAETFGCVLRAEIDNKPMRYRNAPVSQTYARIRQMTENEVPIRGKFVPEIFINSLWAVTSPIALMYAHLICSITDDNSIKIPTYAPLMSESRLSRGHTNNTLNNISMIMPLWFMVRRDPEVLKNYSAIGKNDVINFVNMYNMSTNVLENGTYPIKEHIYNCFHLGSRRNYSHIMGYAGVAFKQEE